MCWKDIEKKCKRIMKLPPSVMFTYIFAKFLGGVGVGLLLGGYFIYFRSDQIAFGWFVLLLAIILCMPACYRICKK